MAVPKVTADDNKLYVSWTLSSGATDAAGPLQVQIQLEKVFDDSAENINWQSNIMEFEITDSLDAADEIADQQPTLFQQWEEKVNTLYSDADADVQTMQTLRNQVQADADAAAQQRQAVEQTASQVTQNATAAAEDAQSAAVSATASQASAAQAQSGATDANTAQGLAIGYANAAKTYSDAAAVSAQTAQANAQAAQQNTDTAQQAAADAQQKVDAFSGYTKEEIDNGFAGALIGNMSGQTVTLDGVQPNSRFRSISIPGRTVQTVSQHGKNLAFPLSSDEYTVPSGSVTFSGGSVKIPRQSSAMTYIISKKMIAVNAGGSYACSFSAAASDGLKLTAYLIRFLDVSGNVLQPAIGTYNSWYKANIVNAGYVIAIPANCVSLKIGLLSHGGSDSAVTDTYSNFQLELGSTATAYTPFVPNSPSPDYPAPISGVTALSVSDGGSNSQTIALPQTLYSLPDGTADLYEAVSGSGEQMIEKIALNGTESWKVLSTQTNCVTMGVAVNGLRPGTTENVLCDRFSSGDSDEDRELFRTDAVSGMLTVRILKMRLSGWLESWADTQKLAAFQAWLSSNPTNVLYPISEPQTIAGTPRTISAYSSQTAVSAEGATCSIAYTRDINAMYQELLEKIQNL